MFWEFLATNSIVAVCTVFSGIAFFTCAVVLIFNHFKKKKK